MAKQSKTAKAAEKSPKKEGNKAPSKDKKPSNVIDLHEGGKVTGTVLKKTNDYYVFETKEGQKKLKRFNALDEAIKLAHNHGWTSFQIVAEKDKEGKLTLNVY